MTEETQNAIGLTFRGPPLAKQGEKTVIQSVKIKDIKLNKNSRMNVSPDELVGLMQSIKEVGLLQPIGLVKSGNGKYEICFGNRRFLACSKLGLNTIPAIVHEKKKESDIDLKNLTENIQRRNISLAEAGRYIKLLEKEGLTPDETAVRLGVTRGYVQSCINAFGEVPEEFQDDLVTNIGRKAGSPVEPGKIGMVAANRIIAARRTYNLTAKDTKKLFKMAKSDKRFATVDVPKYAQALKHGEEDPIAKLDFKHVTLHFKMPQKTFDKLYAEHVADGIYTSMRAYFMDVINGKKHTTNLKAE